MSLLADEVHVHVPSEKSLHFNRPAMVGRHEELSSEGFVTVVVIVGVIVGVERVEATAALELRAILDRAGATALLELRANLERAEGSTVLELRHDDELPPKHIYIAHPAHQLTVLKLNCTSTSIRKPFLEVHVLVYSRVYHPADHAVVFISCDDNLYALAK